jgi:arsenate reductase
MDKTACLDALAALAQETRLDIFRLLTRAEPAGMHAGAIADAVGGRQNTVSTNLAILARAGLIRSVREGRSIRYFADLDGMSRLLAFLMEDCCDGKPEACAPLLQSVTRSCGIRDDSMPTKRYHVLFLCAGNAARSIMAEAILNRWGAGRFHAFSAGSKPRGEVHPYTIDLLRQQNFDPEFARSKSWDEFTGEDAQALDFVFTLCDEAAAEVCPVWPGQPMTAHWGIPDPARATGTEAERRLAFADAYRMLNNRISVFVSLPIASLDRLSLQKHLDEIGRTDDVRDNEEKGTAA